MVQFKFVGEKNMCKSVWLPGAIYQLFKDINMQAQYYLWIKFIKHLSLSIKKDNTNRIHLMLS